MVPACAARSWAGICLPISSTQAPRRAMLLRHVGHIDGDEIHGHAAEQRRGMRTEIDLQSLLAVGDGERAEEAVGIANGKDGDARGTLQRARCAVSHSLAGRNVAHLQDAPGKLDHRRKAVGAGPCSPCRHKAQCRGARGHNDRLARAGCRRSWRGSQAPSAICARRASKVFRCASFFGCSGSSAQARWLITSASSKALEQALCARERRRPHRPKVRAGSCRCRYGWRQGASRARPSRTPPILRSHRRC